MGLLITDTSLTNAAIYTFSVRQLLRLLSNPCHKIEA